MAREYYRRTGRGLLIVPCYGNGRPIEWFTAANLERFVDRVAAARAAADGVYPGADHVAAATWYQGEGNYQTTSAAYRTAFDGLLASLRAAWGVGLPVHVQLVGLPAEAGPAFAMPNGPQSAQIAACGADARNVLATTAATTLRERGLLIDGTHCAHGGYRAVGLDTASSLASAAPRCS